jgi:hypothetical protein
MHWGMHALALAVICCHLAGVAVLHKHTVCTQAVKNVAVLENASCKAGCVPTEVESSSYAADPQRLID